MPILVPPIGDKESSIALVGEAPGRQEETEREPFVGPAGRLLNSLLTSANINRSQCYLTNVVKERPKDNKIEQFLRLDKKNPETDAFRTYRNNLLNELSECKANVIVALGRVPLYALTGEKSIKRWRGSMMSCPYDPIKGRKIIPTYHPSAALRGGFMPGKKDWELGEGVGIDIRMLIVHDLRLVYEERLYPELRLPERNLIIGEQSTDFILAYIDKLVKEGKPVAFDIEVINMEVSCISLSNKKEEAISIAFIDVLRTEQDEVLIWKKIANLLENHSIRKLAQNAMFDCFFLWVKYGIRVEPVDDTMVLLGTTFPEMPKGLDFMCSLFSREPYYKDEGKKHTKMQTSSDEFLRYNAKDSAVLHDIFPAIKKDARRMNNLDAYENQVAIIPPLLAMQARGIRIDQAGLREASKQAGEEIDRLTREFQAACGKPINPNSPKQLADYFYKDRKIAPYKNRKTGNPTTDEKALKRLARRGITEASLVLEIREWSKLKGTYLEMKLDDDNRMRCNFNPVGTKNGRLSSSMTIFGTGMNQQNLPPPFKKFMLADENYLIFEVDLAQAENRIVAYIAPEPNMIEAFENNEDIHSKTAALIFRKRIEDISDEPFSCPIGDGSYSERFWGKKANHALNYGLGISTFALYYEIPENDAKFIRDRYYSAYPGITNYHNWVMNKIINDHLLVCCEPFRVVRPFLGSTVSGNLYKVAMEANSYIPQRTVAEIINRRGLIYIHNHPFLKEVELLNQVHDSIVFQIPKSLGPLLIAKKVRVILDNLERPISWHRREFVIPVDIKMGTRLGKDHMVGIEDKSETGISKAICQEAAWSHETPVTG